jgi:hypothetical protein
MYLCGHTFEEIKKNAMEEVKDNAVKIKTPTAYNSSKLCQQYYTNLF